jgi:hypothetical protein
MTCGFDGSKPGLRLVHACGGYAKADDRKAGAEVGKAYVLDSNSIWRKRQLRARGIDDRFEVDKSGRRLLSRGRPATKGRPPEG